MIVHIHWWKRRMSMMDSRGSDMTRGESSSVRLTGRNRVVTCLDVRCSPIWESGVCKPPLKPGWGCLQSASVRGSEHLLYATYHENLCISKLKSIFTKDSFAK